MAPSGWRKPLAAFTCLLASALAQAADALPPAELFFRHPAVVDAKLSPSGRRLALTATGGGERVALFVVDLEDRGRPTRAATYVDADIREFEWISDRRLVLSVVDLHAGSGEDYRVGPGLYAVNADGSDHVQLVERRGRAQLAADGGRSRSLPPNHLLLHTPAAGAAPEAAQVIVGELRVAPASGLEGVRPLWLDTLTGRTRRLDTGDAPAKVHQWWFSGTGEPLAARVVDGGRESLFLRRPGERGWQRLAEAPLGRLPFFPVHVDDAGQLYVSHVQGPDKERVVARYDAQAGRPASRPLVSTPGFDFTGRLLAAQPGGRVQGVRVETDAEATVWLDPRMQRLQEKADARLPGRVNRIVGCRRCDGDDGVMLVRSWSDRHPGQFVVHRLQTDQWVVVADVQPGVDPDAMARVQFHRARSRDGRDLPVWLTLPKDSRPGEPRPAVVLVHGGPWVRGGHWQWSAMQQFLASRGYVVVAPEFRGSEGYGLAHYRAGWKQWGQAMQDDVADALLWARREGLTDDRACIVGGSYGGYSTLMGLVRHPELYRCGAAWVAVTDLLLLVQGEWWVDDDISYAGRRYRLPELVGDAEADRAMLLDNSPVEQAGRIRAPVLLAFGADDRRVPLSHGTRLREAMQRQGREPEWVVYDGEAHAWRLPATRVDFARRLEHFLAAHLGSPR